MGILIAAAALLLGYGTAYVASDQVRYLSRAGIEEIRILDHRVPISHLALDPKTPAALKAQAKLVLDVRQFAEQLGLEAKETYTTFSNVGRDTLLLVLTASPRNCICPVTWRYPIAGQVPYKGFFNFKQAYQAADKYAKRGDDVNLRPSDAFSTLGWFNDPLLSTALTPDSMELAATVFHEIAHNTLWVKGATDFNESFAQWVGYSATQLFFLSRGDTAVAMRAEGRWQDEQTLGIYYLLLLNRLDSLYALKLPAAANDSGRAVIARWSQDTLEYGFGPILHTYTVGHAAPRPINNAALIGVRLYRTNLDLFDDWDRSNGGDLIKSVYRLQQLVGDAHGDEAFKRMRVALHRVQTPGTQPADTSR
ncbi:MAG TPA: aminopeptidase [Gemmatimonadales bacterium]